VYKKSAISLGVCSLIFLIGLVGCNNSNSTPPISVSLSPSSAQALDQGKTISFTATVTNDSTSKGVTWSLTGAGSLSSQTTSSATYQAPATVTSAQTATVKATSVADTSQTKSVPITINPAPALSGNTLAAATVGTAYNQTLTESGGTTPYTWSITTGTLPAGLSLNASTGVISGTPTASGTSQFTVKVTDADQLFATEALSLTVNIGTLTVSTTSLPNGTMGTIYNATLQATGGIAPYTWSITSGALPGWATLNISTGVISGTPNATGTSNFTVQVTDSQNTPATATKALSITVTSSGGNSDSLLKGQYAFELVGTNGGIAGSFTADGSGNITAGTEDVEDAVSAITDANVAIASGTYTVGTDNRGTLTYTDANSTTFSFSFALGSIASGVASKGALIETDANIANSTGILRLQDSSAFSTSSISGGYAFGLSGWDGSGGVEVTIGSASISGGTISNGLNDVNDNGSITSAFAFTGTLSVSSSGRGTITTSAGNAVVYVVSASEMLEFSANNVPGEVLVGDIEQQSGGPYSISSINGTMVLEDQSSTGVPSPHAMVGLLTSTGNGSATLTADIDDGGTISSNQSFPTTVAFTSAGNGRFTITPQGGGLIVGYMIAPNEAFEAAMASNSVPSFGTFQPQSAGPFTNASLSGSFFFGNLPFLSLPDSSQSAVIESGVISFDGKGNISGTGDAVVGGVLSSDQTFTDTYTAASNGRATTGSGNSIIYVVSPTKFVVLFTIPGDPNPFIQIMQQ
jgi:Putative Ig domain